VINALQILDSENAKESFMRGIIELAKVAGVEDSEVIFFEQTMETLGLSEEVRRELGKLLYTDKLDVPFKFTDKKQALFFLREGIQLCFVDGRYQDEEKILIRKMAEQLHISSDSLAKLEEWVTEGINWSNRGDELIYLEV
jgi:hypothetical protein